MLERVLVRAATFADSTWLLGKARFDQTSLTFHFWVHENGHFIILTSWNTRFLSTSFNQSLIIPCAMTIALSSIFNFLLCSNLLSLFLCLAKSLWNLQVLFLLNKSFNIIWICREGKWFPEFRAIGANVVSKYPRRCNLKISQVEKFNKLPESVRNPKNERAFRTKSQRMQLFWADFW